MALGMRSEYFFYASVVAISIALALAFRGLYLQALAVAIISFILAVVYNAVS